MSAAGAAPRRRRRGPFVVTALLLGLVLALVLVELAFRLCWTLPPWFAELQQAGMYVATADGDIALQPGYRGTLKVDTETKVAINSLGMRGPELPPARDGERRLLVLGDSMVWGYGVEAEQALPARLAAAMAAQLPGVVVGNGGVPGYGSKHVAQHLPRLDRAFGADAFLVCVCLGNDAMDDLQPERTVFAGLMLQGPWARLVAASWRGRLAYRSRAALWFESWLFQNHPQSSLLTVVPPDAAESERLFGVPIDRAFAGLFLDVVDKNTSWQQGAPPVVPRLLATLRSSLLAMQLAADGRPLVLLLLPTSWQVLPDRWHAKLRELGFDPAGFERGTWQRRCREVADELGIPMFDATPILEVTADPLAQFVSDGAHYSAAGHEALAQWLASALPPLLRR